jgi:hypothetical protein
VLLRALQITLHFQCKILYHCCSGMVDDGSTCYHTQYDTKSPICDTAIKLRASIDTTLHVFLRAMTHASHTISPPSQVRVDTDRDFYLTPSEAVRYGLIDEVVTHGRTLPDPKIPSLQVRRVVWGCLTWVLLVC